MQRTQISLSDDDRRLLDAAAARTGRSMSSLIREAVQRTFAAASDEDADLAAIDAAIGAWSDRSFDGAAYVGTLRSGRRLDEAARR